MRQLGAAGSCLLIVLAWSVAGAEERTRKVDFNRDVRPILSENCFACHGPDKNKRKGKLRLDTKEGAFEKAIVPGKPEESEFYARIVSDDDEEHMPPADSGKTLTRGEVETLRRWIEEGAEWKGHWAYIPPVLPDVPRVDDPAFVENDIDRFILAKLRERGLAHAPEADKVTLIRRLSFDLTGLPPTPQEVDAFLTDSSPEAYERLVDRLLASPHHGERMASYWLDLVRYADTTGIHGDNHRDVWLYRDYVIRAFNENKPFDQFTVEQLSGDLLPAPTEAQRIGSGYNRLLMTTQEGGAQAKEYLAKYAADRVRNASSVWLGATLGCAECHDHKFDPFKTKDFYRFAAFFADLKEVAVGEQEYTKMPTPEQKATVERLDEEMAPLRKVLGTQTAELDAAQQRWEKSLAEKALPWDVLRPIDAASKNGAALHVNEDGSVLASGPNPDSDTYILTLKPGRRRITALRLEVLPDPSLPSQGPGRAFNGNFVLHELAVTVQDRPLKWSGVTATHSQDGWNISGAVDGNPGTGWAILPQAGRGVEAVFELETDLESDEATALKVSARQDYGGQHTIGHFRLSATAASRPVRAGGGDLVPLTIADILKVAPDRRSDAQERDLSAFYRGIAPELSGPRSALAELEKEKARVIESMPRTLVSEAVPPRPMRILPRGNWLDDSGPLVTPAVPEFLSRGEVEGRRATRRDLALWLASRDNPLVARVFVNRLWKLAFGQGIVATLEDFGSQGAWPTHHELLDWLAIEFVDHGWDMRRMLKLMVMSGTYRQSSGADERMRQLDPSNKWLARQGRSRLEAEMVRDNVLSIGGLLVPTLGGPSARPYQPAGYWFHLNFPKREYQADHGDGLYRRGLYTYWCRTFLHPSLLAFDAPTREECTVNRTRANTPLQALVLLDDPTYVEAARALAERLIREGGSEAGPRLQLAYRLALSRPPRPEEVAVLSTLLAKHTEHYRADRKAAGDLVHTGERPVPSDIEAPELAAWTSIARVILNLHETYARN